MKIVSSRRRDACPVLPIPGGKIQFHNGRATLPDEVAQTLVAMSGGFYQIVGESIPNNIEGARILIIRHAGLGDVLMVTVIVRELAQRGALVDVVTEGGYVCLFDGNPYVNAVFADGQPTGTDYLAVLDLRGHVEHMDSMNRNVHRVDGFCQYADIQNTSRHLDYFVNADEAQWAASAISEHVPGASPVIGYVWRASRTERSWSDVKHREVLAAILDAGYRVVILDKDGVTVDHHPSVWNSSGTLCIRQCGAIINACDVIVSPDTGLFHLASALNKPVVSYFATMPVERRATHTQLTMVDSRSNCSLWPCRGYSCRFNRDENDMPRCLDSDPGEVVSAIQAFIPVRAKVKSQDISKPRMSQKVSKKLPKTNTKVIAMTLYRRPERTRKTLAALAACYGIGEYTVLINCDFDMKHGPDCNEVYAAAKAFEASGVAKHVEVFCNDPKLGIDVSKLFLLPKAFSLSEFVILCEDDTTPAKDALRWFEWAADEFRSDDRVYSISGYNRHPNPTPEFIESVDPYGYVFKTGFNPWLWGTFRDRYEKHYGMDGSKYAEVAKDETNGIFDHFMHRKQMLYVTPVLGRSLHDDWQVAEHTPSESWWRENEDASGCWAGLINLPDPSPSLWHSMDTDVIVTTNPGGAVERELACV